MIIICKCGMGIIGWHDKDRGAHWLQCVNGRCDVKTEEYPSQQEAAHALVDVLYAETEQKS